MNQLVGQVVEFLRPVIIQAATTKYDQQKDATEHIPAAVRRDLTQGVIIGYEPRKSEDGKILSPILQLAFIHPDRVQALRGSGWRDAFDRILTVRPGDDESVEGKPVAIYNTHNDVILQYLADADAVKPVVSAPVDSGASGDGSGAQSGQVGGAAAPAGDESKPPVPAGVSEVIEVPKPETVAQEQAEDAAAAAAESQDTPVAQS